MAELKSTIVKGNLRVTDDADIKTIKENGTSLSDKYLGKTAKASDADKLDGNDSSYYLNYNNLTNKPTIPTVNNATLTIQKNGTQVATFTSNASSNVTANITVPTKTSELTNDSGFITSETNQKVKAGSVTFGDNDVVDIVAGDNVSVTGATTGTGAPKITISATYSDATTSASGLMSATDKTKLNGIASGAEVNVQSDWNVTDNTSDAFIKNKPTIPTVDYPVTDVKVNNTSVVSNKVANIVTNSAYNATSNKIATMSDLPNTSNFIQKSNTSGLVKNDGTIDTTSYSTFSGSYNDLSNKPTIPTKTSDLTNDRFVRYDTNAQGLDATQKSNARTNIGAGTSDLTIGTSSTTAAAGDHTHALSITETTTPSTSYIGIQPGAYYILKSGGETKEFKAFSYTLQSGILKATTSEINNSRVIDYDPYSATTASSTWVNNEANARKIYLGTVNPVREERINLNGYLYSTKVYSGGELVTTSSSSKWNDYYLASNPNGYTSNTGTVTSVRVQAGTGLSSSTSTAQTSTLNTTISVASGYKLPTTTEWSEKASITVNPSSTTNTITSIGVNGTNYALGMAFGVATNTGVSTSTGQVTRAVTVSGTYTLSTGATAIVMFTNYVYNSGCTLNINSTGAKTMRVNGKALSTTNSVAAYIPYLCRYDGTYQQLYAIGHNLHEHVTTLTFKGTFGTTSNADAVVTIRWSDDYSYQETTSFYTIYSAILAGRATINGYFQYTSSIKCPIIFGDAYLEEGDDDQYYHIRLYWYRSTSYAGEINWYDNWPTSNFSIVDKLV